ncbi:MAG: arginase [Planctomycetota bacterium]
MSAGVTRVGLLGVPLDLGAGRRGTDMGPSAIRLAGVTAGLQRLGVEVKDHGYVAVAAPEMRDPGRADLRFGREIERTCGRLRDRVRAILDGGAMPLVLGGDHSIAMGTVAGAASHFRTRQESIGLLWIDAHADLNTPSSSPSGNVHGMPLATILGNGEPSLMRIGGDTPWVPPEKVVILGLRDVDPGEKQWIRDHNIRVYSMKEIDQRGISACMRDALAVVTDGTAGFHLSFDMDSLDPEEAPGVGTPVPGGLTYREAHLACELIADTSKLVSMEIVETNPILDERNRTGRLAVELALSAVGKTIY